MTTLTATQCPAPQTSRNLSDTITLLIDIHEALEENELIEEARLVSRHLQQLASPQIESRIEKNGIEPVLAEMAESFATSIS